MSIEVFRDAWGIPHLRAGDPLELAYAQGHNAAIDRAWQLEVERHRAQGTSAAFLGADSLDWDRFARQARLADTARRCYARLDEPTAAWLDRYVAGAADGLREGADRAPQFAATGLAPGRWEPWTPMALWLSHHILFAGFPSKLWRRRVMDLLGERAVALFATDGIATSGSNGWLLAPGRTANGAALIAGDPHRFIEDPGIYQQIHLACPEFDVVGLAVPGVPGIAHFGHTGSVAWAITNAMADYQDLYHERLRRTARGGVEALGPDGWRSAAAHTETIEVAGSEPVTVEIVETDRGPVVIGGPDGTDGALSLRYPPRVREELGFAALPALLRARTVADVDRALEKWAEPVNVVLAADTAGGLLHRVAGAVPRRDARNLLRPVPAWDAAHAWRGWHAPLPRAEVTDHAVMANQRGLAAPLGVEFSAPHRADRIAELLAGSGRWTGESMAAVHTDTYLGSTATLLGLLAGLPRLSPAADRLRTQLLGWDRRMDRDSVAAGHYAALRSAVVRLLAAEPVLAPLAEPSGLPELFAPWLSLTARIAFALERLLAADLPAADLPAADLPAADLPAADLPADDRAADDLAGDGLLPGLLTGIDRAELVRTALEQLAATQARDGTAPPTWGDTHRLAPWQALPDPDPTPDPPPGPALGGDHDCVLATSCIPGLTDLSARASAARYVWDLGRREDSRWVVPFGAHAVPGHPHHRDQLPLWLSGALVPVITDWNRLTKETGDDH
ncbi:penicillin acylase family protein [Kitasatospora sp. NBC_01302]|uniref:penicillin acylase family protein n=1 Tax=Kitasatospora sp. NBC_01302 TaxID=2903575 RepID=UPI002E0F7176|nr:penicillin acylase family protein [Kitasatospora sp. NBC_01302]